MFTYYGAGLAAPWLLHDTHPVPSSVPFTPQEAHRFRRQFRLGLETYWTDTTLSASDQRSTLWSAIYSAITGRMGLSDPSWLIRRLPLELIGWPVHNSQRQDLFTRKDWLAQEQTALSLWAIAPDESPLSRPEDDHSLYRMDDGNGLSEQSGTIFLHAYWLARFHGVLEQPAHIQLA
mmetsp:Transcript_67902/g.159784  ORF Transcript_67902/g.159784 Transcript_67902/m.159784 type:complete len:177 (-) Transcript_67902:44-574(-)